MNDWIATEYQLQMPHGMIEISNRRDKGWSWTVHLSNGHTFAAGLYPSIEETKDHSIKAYEYLRLTYK